jgi:uncharacterized protein YndB with AHSA1/START domain
VDGRASDTELSITRLFDAPRSLVFRMWVDPKHVVRWWGPGRFTTLSCTMDVRPGGAWRVRSRSPEGVDHTEQGVYREIVEPERLVFTHAWEDAAGTRSPETLVTVTFIDEHGKTIRLPSSRWPSATGITRAGAVPSICLTNTCRRSDARQRGGERHDARDSQRGG